MLQLLLAHIRRLVMSICHKSIKLPQARCGSNQAWVWLEKLNSGYVLTAGGKHIFIQGHIFNDPIHGQIELHLLLVKIIDTPQFQRLRYIKQLGGTYLVYPGATHTRFEHSIGVAYLAKEKQQDLEKKQKELITDKDILCVQIAALCYNLGHGPFSYLFKDRFIPEVQSGQTWTHEVASVWLFLDIVEKNEELKKELIKDHKLNQEDFIFIQELIKGVDTAAPEVQNPWPAKGRTEDKASLYEIVANKWNGIDVRKWDYFARDCHYLGIPNNFDYQCLMKSAQVCEGKWVDGRSHICFRDKVADNIYDMFHTRYTLYHQAYQHKIVNIIEEKVKDAFVEHELSLRFERLSISEMTESLLQDDAKRKISRITSLSPPLQGKREKSKSINEKMAEFIKLTDHIFEEILYSTDPRLEGAQMELKDVVKRCLPKCVGEARIPRTKFMDIKALQQGLTVLVIQLDYNIKDENPIDNVYFYRKRNPFKARKINKFEMVTVELELEDES
ncbi:deoxynucleoside triphosphate triphosphohydrolase SAMHD1-like [Chanodichthys erythropterus]|uniref:deoxynucleoside triphosphate triphosphohydrolase SAMHD1-like n=1 Tax=Chanodichthys erythropterus TaxID=933992 RepID=UPI00351F71D9